MIGRNLETRIVKLETKTARANEMLVVWRRPYEDIAEALKAITYAAGDKVICAEWFDDIQLPAPRWYKDRLRSEMNPDQYEQIERTIERIATFSETDRHKAGFAPFPRFTEARLKEMSDAELIHVVLGAAT